MATIATILLGVIWASLTGSFAVLNLGLGLAIGYGILRLFGGLAGTRSRWRVETMRRAAAGVLLAVYAVYELLVANVRVAWYTVSDLRTLTPAILAIPLRPDLSDGELTLLAMLVTLTPGTLTLDVAEDRQTLFVHFMHVDDAAEAVASVKTGFERRILEVTR